MTTQIKRRRGTTSQHSTFTGAEAEITIDTDKDTVVVHDGSTAGGYPLAKESSLAGKVDTTGDTMTGDLTVPNIIVSGNVDGRDVSVDGAKLDGIEAAADVTDTTNVTAAGALMDSEVTNLAQVKAFDATDYVAVTGDTMTGNLSFGDNDKAIFGAGSDLQIYHDGSNSFIVDNGTGNLQIDANDFRVRKPDGSEAMIHANADGAVKLFYDGGATPKLATTATGIDVTGTVTADGLTVETGSGNTYPTVSTNADEIVIANKSASGPSGITIFSDNASQGNIFFGDEQDADSGRIVYDHNGNANTLSFFANGTLRQKIDGSTGDISFYEATGTTPKFFWDASAEALGIGTAAPSEMLHVDGGNMQFTNTVSNDSRIYFTHSTSANRRSYIGALETDGNGNSLIFAPNANGADASEAMRIDSSGNVGIGTSSAAYPLTVNGYIGVRGGNGITFLNPSNNYTADIYNGAASGTSDLRFKTQATERMRIDSSGNLLVGTTDTSPWNDTSGAGIALRSDGIVSAAASGTTALRINRTSTDGNIAEFYKDGSTVGSIGIESGGLTIDGEAGHAGLRFGGSDIAPRDNGADVDAGIQLGNNIYRFTDLYLSGGVYLGGTGAANKLDDYEEGNWTPSSPTVTFTGTQGRYTKIGRQVFYQGTLAVPSNSSGVQFNIDGIPFAQTSLSLGAAYIRFTNHGSAVTFHVNTGSRISVYNLSGSATTLASVTGKRFDFVGSYFVA